MFTLRRSLVCLALVSVASSAHATTTDWVTVLKSTYKQVVRLQILRQGQSHPGTCTGVVLNQDTGVVLTAAHCVDKPQTETISITANGRHAEVIKINTLLDLGLLKTSLRGEKHMLLADKTPEPGTPIAVIGYAFGDADAAFQFGYISQTKNGITKMVWLNADVVGGDSGGACFDTTGKLVAIQSQLMIFYSSGLAASTPVERIRDFAHDYLPKVTP